MTHCQTCRHKIPHSKALQEVSSNYDTLKARFRPNFKIEAVESSFQNYLLCKITAHLKVILHINRGGLQDLRQCFAGDRSVSQKSDYL